jgi:hypothetical protein
MREKQQAEGGEDDEHTKSSSGTQRGVIFAEQNFALDVLECGKQCTSA